jgi:abnormal spindle-like microcephaly-associated protein
MIQKQAAVTLQGWWKGIVTRRHYLSIKHSALAIERMYLSYKEMTYAREEYIRKKNSALWMQRKWRSKVIARKERQRFVELRSATITCQAHFKGKIQRKTYRKWKESVLKIESHYLAFKSQKVSRSLYLTLRNATVTLQMQWRAVLEGRAVREDMLIKRKATVKIQAFIRGSLQREKYATLKKTVLLVETRLYYNKLCKQQQRSFKQLKDCVAMIEYRRKLLLQQREDGARYRLIQYSALSIQHWIRRVFLARKLQTMIVYHRQVVHLQSCIRMLQQRRKYFQMVKSCKIIQQRYRALCAGRQDRNQFLSLRNATLTLQRKARAVLAGRRQRIEFLDFKQKVITVQSIFRMVSARKQYQNYINAVTILQCAWRRKVATRVERSMFLKKKASVKLIEAKWISLLEARSLSLEFQNTRRAVRFIQDRFRFNRHKRVVRRYNAAACTIQQYFKFVYVPRKEFIAKRHAAVTIQRLWRGHSLRKRYHFKVTPVSTERRASQSLGALTHRAIRLLQGKCALSDLHHVWQQLGTISQSL